MAPRCAGTTVLAYGWTQNTTSKKSSWPLPVELDRPNNPVEQDYAAIPAGEDVLVRGLGMGFYDIMALTTIGGGKFVEDPSARSGLRYEPCGQEPNFVFPPAAATPYHPKSEYGELPTMPRTA